MTNDHRAKNGPPTPLHALKTLINYESVKHFLVDHGCTIDEEETTGPECTVIFPEGTTRTELYPRTIETRFRLLLPDQTELREVDTRSERSHLFLILDTLPDAIQKEFHRERGC